ncbi:hypothetical protein H0H93_011877 [Arthromyces matolae]|nr:hypothetical protein H0H93_011877 [Arthromyces matolae]
MYYVSFATEKNLNSTGVYMGQSAPKVKKGTISRTRRDILQDLATCANEHNGDTFTVSAWNLLGLIKDISRAKTHILALTLRRTTSMNPRTLYDLVDAEVIPMTVMDELYADRRSMVDSSPFSIREMLESDALRREPHGALGSVMVITTELPRGDDSSPRQALTNVSTFLHDGSVWVYDHILMLVL